MMTAFPSVEIRLPGWVDQMLGNGGRRYRTTDEQMAVAIELARRNVVERTGGPFGAAVFEIESGRLLAPGVNLVLGSSTAVAHAEIVALALAGVVTGNFDLGAPGHPQAVLVASTEPCAMCFGAVPWSGVRRLVCGARDEDARAIGFDEGPKLIDWQSALESRGIEVVRDIGRDTAVEVLGHYATAGGEIYNGRRGD
jgi:tRNA(Arg) A34 adenosine deaminase TadA